MKYAYRSSRVINQALAGALLSSEPEPVNNSAQKMTFAISLENILGMLLKKNTHRPVTNLKYVTLDVHSPTSRAAAVRFGPTTNTQMSTQYMFELYGLRRPEASVFLFTENPGGKP